MNQIKNFSAQKNSNDSNAHAATPLKNFALACVELSSVAFGYRVLNQISQLSSIEILEASPAGGGNFLIIARGDHAEISAMQISSAGAVDTASGVDAPSVVDHEVFEQITHQQIESIYSLSSARLAESLVVIEAESVSALLAVTFAVGQQHHLQCVEIKINRGSRAGGHAFLTGVSANCRLAAEAARTKLKLRMSGGVVEEIEAPNETFRRHFNFSGQA